MTLERVTAVPLLLLLATFVLAPGARELHAQEAADLDPTDLRAMSLEELMSLDVTSVSRAPEPYAQAAAAIQVITQQQIRRAGASTIVEALRLATNLHVAQKNASSWAVSARGFNTELANKLLVLIDGRTVYTPLFSGVFWDRQDYLLEDIERIEVVSGPGGTLWGANAMNGVINIITRSARDTEGVYADARVGPRMGAFASARYGNAPNDAFAYRVYGKYFDRDNEVFPDGRDGTDSWRRWQGGFRSDVTAGRDLFTIQGDAYDSDTGSPTGGRGEASGFNVLGRWTRTFSGDADLQLQLYWDVTHLMIPTPEQVLNGTPVAPAGSLEDDLDTYDLDFQHRFPLGGRSELVWGFGYRFMRNEVQNAPSLAFHPETLDRDLVSGFVQNELSLSSSLSATIGTKVEHNDYTGVELEPTARLAWTTGPRTVWAAVSRAVRMPSRIDRHSSLPTPGLAPIGVPNLLVGNDSFESETVVTLELGYRTRLGADAAGSISTFYNRYDDLRSTSLSPPDPIFQLPFPFYYANNLEATTYGAELVADVVLREDWSVRGGYTLVKQEVEVKEGEVDFNNALNETADPEHQVFLFSSIDLPARVDFDIGVRWIGSFTYNDAGVAEKVPDYWEAEARLAWAPTPWAEVAVEGQNLLHDRHLEYAISDPNPRQEIRRALRGRVSIRW